MLEEGEKEGATRLLIAPIRGREIEVAELMVTLLPETEQVSPDGREQVADVAVNSLGKEITKYEKGRPEVAEIWKLRLVEDDKIVLENECDEIVMAPTTVFWKFAGEFEFVFNLEF